MIRPIPRAFACLAALLGGLGLVGAACTEPPPKVPVTPTATPSVSAVTQAPTATASAAPGPPLRALHPCVPEFASREITGCEPAPAPEDYGAVVKAFQALADAGPRGPRPKPGASTPREFDELEQEAVETARGFLCSSGDAATADQRASVGFELGRIYRGANHLEEAAIVLREVVLLTPADHPEAEYAAPLLLESLDLLFKNGRPECMSVRDEMRENVLKHVCDGPGAKDRQETCDRLRGAQPTQ